VPRKSNGAPQTRIFIQIEPRVCHSKRKGRQIELKAVPRTVQAVPKTCDFVQQRLKLVQTKCWAVQVEQ